MGRNQWNERESLAQQWKSSTAATATITTAHNRSSRSWTITIILRDVIRLYYQVQYQVLLLTVYVWLCSLSLLSIPLLSSSFPHQRLRKCVKSCGVIAKDTQQSSNVLMVIVYFIGLFVRLLCDFCRTKTVFTIHKNRIEGNEGKLDGGKEWEMRLADDGKRMYDLYTPPYTISLAISSRYTLTSLSFFFISLALDKPLH